MIDPNLPVQTIQLSMSFDYTYIGTVNSDAHWDLVVSPTNGAFYDAYFQLDHTQTITFTFGSDAGSFMLGAYVGAFSIADAYILSGYTLDPVYKTLTYTAELPAGYYYIAANPSVLLSGDSPPVPTWLPISVDVLVDVGPSVSIAAEDADKIEGDSGTTPFTFTVSLSEPSTQTVTVDWSVAGSGIVAPASASDFAGSPLLHTVSFGPGETSKQIEVQVVGDIEVEPDEDFAVTLSNPSGLRIANGTANGTIRTDAIHISASLTKSEIYEGLDPTTLTVQLSKAADYDIDVHVDISQGQRDLSFSTLDIRIAKGSTQIEVPIAALEDTSVEF